MYEAYFLALTVTSLAGWFVFVDAYEHEEPNAGWWALGTFLVLIVVLPLYLYHRAYGRKRVA
jgi:hypothetical protein